MEKVKLDKISFEQIISFIEAIEESSLMEVEFIRRKYSERATNFSETAAFLENLKLFTFQEKNIMLTGKGKKLLLRRKDSRNHNKEEATKRYILKTFLQQVNIFSEEVNSFFSHFQNIDGKYTFKPTTSQRVRYSGIRNLLLDFDFIQIDHKSKAYSINGECNSIFEKSGNRRKMTIEKFKTLLEERSLIGYKAECAILKYERKRLFKYPALIKKIEHVSQRDVVAGYDIKSFEESMGDNIKEMPRYIEVKAVSLFDYRFSWTHNEIEKARFYRNRYFIYLLPVISRNKFDFKALRIIQNPFENIYSNRKGWYCEEEVLTFSMLR